jgi:transposase
MKLTLRQQLTQFVHTLQSELFPVLEESAGPLDASAKRLVAILEMIPLGRFIPSSHGWIGRPSKERYAIACAFIAKSVYGMTHTRQLLERLESDAQFRLICGFTTAQHLPHESTFSRAFAEFAAMELPQFVHEALIVETQKDRLIGHISRDSTAIEARERYPEGAVKRTAKTPKPKGKRGPKPGKRGPHKRHKGGKPKYAPPSNKRLHRQRSMKLSAMLAELPQQCNAGVKTSGDGNQKYWRGYKLHLDVADGQIPISGILTAASLHDSQAAIPLATMTARRVTNLYDVMDTAYDATEILEHSRSLGHVPIVRPAKRGKQDQAPESLPTGRTFSWAEEDRFRERTTVERVYARLKDEFGGRQIRVRGAKKIMAHLMFGVLALTADQIMKLTS